MSNTKKRRELKLFVFLETKEKNVMEIREARDSFQFGSRFDSVLSGSMADAITVFNMRHTKPTFHGPKPRYMVVVPGMVD